MSPLLPWHTASEEKWLALTEKNLTFNCTLPCIPPQRWSPSPSSLSPASLGVPRGLESGCHLQRSRAVLRQETMSWPHPDLPPQTVSPCPYTHWCLSSSISEVGVFLSRGAARQVPSTGSGLRLVGSIKFCQMKSKDAAWLLGVVVPHCALGPWGPCESFCGTFPLIISHCLGIHGAWMFAVAHPTH